MAAGPKLDGPGTVKLVVLEEAMLLLQSLHGLVERMGVELKSGKSIAPLTTQLKRYATPLQGKLKSQFQLISDQVTGMLLVATRGGQEGLKLRAYREAVAQVRTQLEIAMTQTKEKHAIHEEEAAPDLKRD